MNSIVFALLLFSGIPDEPSSVSDTTVIVSHYDVDIVLDNFLESAGFSAVTLLHHIVPGIVKNPAPEQFVFTETITEKKGQKNDAFLMRLTDEKRTLWAHIASNDAIHSFVRPPKKPRIPIRSDALRFVEAVRTLSAITTHDTITTRFFFEKDTVNAFITETALDTVSARRFAEYKPRRFSVIIVRATDYELFTQGEVVVGIFRNVQIYPRVRARMVKDGVEMTLTLTSDPEIRK